MGAQRDIAERGATMEEVQKAIDDRKPDFAAYVEPQKSKADIVIQELVYVESAICNSGTKNYGELTEQMVKNADAPGSENGTGLFQTLASFKIREAYESITKSK